MKRFEIGKTYKSEDLCGNTHILYCTDRTDKTVSFGNGWEKKSFIKESYYPTDKNVESYEMTIFKVDENIYVVKAIHLNNF